jgi:hypothetical protein
LAAGVPGRGLKMKLKLLVEAHLVDQLHHLLEVRVGLAGEAHDEVRLTQMSGRTARSLRIVRLVFGGGVAALHLGHEDAVGAVLAPAGAGSWPAWARWRRPRSASRRTRSGWRGGEADAADAEAICAMAWISSGQVGDRRRRRPSGRGTR